MNQQNRLLLDRRIQFAEDLFKKPNLADVFLCRKCEIKVLVVADSFLYFSNENFGLSDFVSVLESTSHPSAKLVVDKAHRGDPGATRLAGADKDFTFTSASLSDYDVVFLMAAARGSTMAASELRALAEFMDAGGGVFATGDHEDLGEGMCGQLMRVRSMRKWHWPGPGPRGEPVAPDGTDATRHDTNREGHDAGFEFDDQSDDVAQVIRPRYYTVSRTFLASVREPHPLLCGPEGVVNVLPDHPHEGECIEPSDLTENFSYDGKSFEEYPADSGGTRVRPQVIATSRMIPGAEVPESGKPPIPGGSFGAISAYDGHHADVGRVVCDATWHHFININLTGDSGAPVGDPKRVGFLASAAGEEAFEKIKAYFRNIALWAAPAAKQRCMRNRRFWNVLRAPQLREEFENRFELAKVELPTLVSIGKQIELFPRIDASRCQFRSWNRDLILRRKPELRDLPCLIDGCRPDLGNGPDPAPFLDDQAIQSAFIGGAALAVLEDIRAREAEPRPEAPSDSSLQECLDKGLEVASKAIAVSLKGGARGFEKLAERF